MYKYMLDFLTNLLGIISKIVQKDYIFPGLLLVLTIIILILYQQFYSMSCPDNQCMEWICIDPDTQQPLQDVSFEYKLVSKSGIGIAKWIILLIIIIGFIGIALTFVSQLTDKGIVGSIQYRPDIIKFTFMMGFIYFLLVWWTRTCGINDNGETIPVELQCDNNPTEWESKYTKITGLLVFLILFFAFWEIWNLLLNFTNIIGPSGPTKITNLSELSVDLRKKHLGKGGVCGMRSTNESKLQCIKNLEGINGGKGRRKGKKIKK